MPYVGTDDVQATVARACELGGWVLQSPTSTHGRGRAAVITDPAGAALAFVESPPSDHRMVWDEPGGVPWVECLSRDAAASRSVREELLGWHSREGVDGYVVFDVGGQRVGGLMTMPGSVPVEVPSYWLVYFAVADVDDVYAGATGGGGDVLEPARDLDEGRFAVLADAAGAVLAVFESHPA
jgi:predicted enzyme related to lactoylglutathione lyase